MNFQEKKKSYGRLRGASHLEADRELLKKLAPAHALLGKSVFRRNDFAGEVLYALLELASEEEIRDHRRAFRHEHKADLPENENPEPKKDLTHDEIVAFLAGLGVLPIDTVVVLGDDAYRLTEDGFEAQEWQGIESKEGEISPGAPAEQGGAENVITDAAAEIEEIISDAEEKAEEIVEEAEEKAEEIIEEAEQKAEEIVAEAEKKSDSPKPAAEKPATKGSSRKPSTRK